MRKAQQLADYGYFYDALSGEFLPPSDPQGRIHTLARLMTATFMKGEVSKPRSIQETRTYRPSWAPISSAVSTPHGDDIRSLTLTSSRNQLSVVHEIVHDHNKDFREVLVFTEDTQKPAFKAPLIGHSYADIRDGVRELAQEFFDMLLAQQQ